jgi:ABC-type dipeptide/oligopeptide/nickel transport system permease component
MAVYFLRRLIEAVPMIFMSTIVVFLLLRLLPGDPAQALAGTDTTPQTLARIRQELGLNEPLPVQYGIWINRLLHGDLGSSVLSRLPVGYLIGLAIPATIELTIGGLFITVLIGVPLGILAALRNGTRFDWAVLIFNGTVLAVPGFWLSILSILLFALALGWLPPGGFVDIRTNPVGGLRALLLPSVTLALPAAAAISRQVRTGMLEVLEEDFIRTARAKGLANRTVVVRHALRNAMLPVATVLGLQFGRLLGGAVITESVFTFPGVGRLLVQSIGQRDYTVVQATLLLFIVVFTIINLLTDMSYAVLDPRVRLGRSGSS